MARVLRGLGFVLVAMTLVAAYEFFTSDDQIIEADARSKACADRGPTCHAALARFAKTPFYQDRQFRVGGATVDVRCARESVLIGPFRCAVR